MFKNDPKERLKHARFPAPTTHSGKSFHSFTILTKNDYLQQLRLDSWNFNL